MKKESKKKIKKLKKMKIKLIEKIQLNYVLNKNEHFQKLKILKVLKHKFDFYFYNYILEYCLYKNQNLKNKFDIL